MGIATSPPAVERISPQKQPSNSLFKSFVQDVGGDNSSSNSMSQGYHQGIFSFSDGFGRPSSSTSQDDHQQQQQQQHIAQQSRREKLRVQGFDPPPGHHPLVPMEGDQEEPGGIYETATGAAAGNMLSEMFNFPTTPGPTTTELLASHSQMQGGYRLPTRPVGPTVGFGSGLGDWYNNGAANRQGMVLGGSSSSFGGSIGDGKQLNADSAAVMQLFLMNPQQQQQQRSPSPPTPQAQLHHQAFAVPAGGPFDGASSFGTTMAGGVVEGQGLSLSLSSSLQQFEMAKAAHDRHQELRVRDGVLYFNTNSSSNNNQNPQQQQQLQGQGQQSQHVHMGYGPVVNVLRNSKYSRAAQELLEEFCSVGRGQFKGSRIGRHHGSSSSNPNPNTAASTAGASTSVAGSSSSSKDVPALSPADRFEHQRKKSKLLSMLDEVDRRYNHYCDQMQMVVNSFDSVMGFGAATPYTALAQKAMSRHFKCLKDAIAAQLKHTCELLGEKETGSGSGITKGETPRLRLLDQSLRQQRAFHQMGMMEQEAWRPQRGLPERSVNVLRAWLFEHFLHPYPSDADKHLLARQTGLSRNQVSNWFINARVRLWKPMVEEMYQQEAKEAEAAADQSSSQRDYSTTAAPAAAAAAGGGGNNQPSQSPSSLQHQSQSQHLQQQQQQKRISETDAPERFLSDNTAGSTSVAAGGDVDPSNPILPPIIDAQDLCGAHNDLYREYGTAAGLGPAARMRLGTTGDVSLTLGLRHAGNAGPHDQKNRSFTIRDFGGC